MISLMIGQKQKTKNKAKLSELGEGWSGGRRQQIKWLL